MFFVPKINTTKNTINILGFLLPYKAKLMTESLLSDPVKEGFKNP